MKVCLTMCLLNLNQNPWRYQDLIKRSHQPVLFHALVSLMTMTMTNLALSLLLIPRALLISSPILLVLIFFLIFNLQKTILKFLLLLLLLLLLLPLLLLLLLFLRCLILLLRLHKSFPAPLLIH